MIAPELVLPLGATVGVSLLVLASAWTEHARIMRSHRLRIERSVAPPQSGVTRGTKVRGGRSLR